MQCRKSNIALLRPYVLSLSRCLYQHPRFANTMPSPMKTAWKTVRKGMTKNSPSRNRSTIASSTLTPTQSTTSLLARRGPLFEKATPDDAHQSQDPTSTVEQGEEKSHPGDSKQVAGKADPKPYLQQEGTKTEPKCSAQDAHPENWQGEPGLSDSHGEAIDCG